MRLTDAEIQELTSATAFCKVTNVLLSSFGTGLNLTTPLQLSTGRSGLYTSGMVYWCTVYIY